MGRMFEKENIYEFTDDEVISDILCELLDWQDELDDSAEDKIRYAMIDSFIDIVIDKGVN